jgi:hypothetical protein
MRNPMEFVRHQMSSFAGPSPDMENLGTLTVPTGTPSLHSRFNPNLVGFGIVNPFEPSSGMQPDLSQHAAIQISYTIKPTESLK